jgi:hypothetical protein
MLTGVMAALPVTANGASTEDKQFQYKVLSDNTVHIVRFTGAKSSNREQVITVPDTIEDKPVTSIEYMAFRNIFADTVNMGKNIESIDKSAFTKCYINKIKVDSDNKYFCDIDGVLFNKSKTKLIAYPNNSNSGYSIPKGTKVIGASAFYYSEIQAVKIPNTVVKIENSAFSLCNKLANVVIPNSVTAIDTYAFHLCSKLKTITLGKKLKTIGKGAFSDCGKLKEIKIPNSVTTIEDGTFGFCNKLEKITFGKAVKNIDGKAFEYSTGIKEIKVSAKNKYFSSKDGVLFNKDKTILYIFPSAKNLKTYTVPKSVKKIASKYGAFYNCKYLTKVVIGKNVKKISSRAFDYSSKLKSISVSSANKKFSSKAGVLYNKNKTSIIRYPEGKTSKSYTVAGSVKNIVDLSFWNNTSLKKVTVPKTVKSMAKCGMGLYDNMYDDMTRVSGFKLYGKKGSAAEDYAKDYNLKFVAN